MFTNLRMYKTWRNMYVTAICNRILVEKGQVQLLGIFSLAESREVFVNLTQLFRLLDCLASKGNRQDCVTSRNGVSVYWPRGIKELNFLTSGAR